MYLQENNKIFSLILSETTSYAKALATLLREMDWKTYTIIYEKEDGLVRLQEILKMHNKESITVRKLEPGSDHRFVNFNDSSFKSLQTFSMCLYKFPQFS